MVFNRLSITKKLALNANNNSSSASDIFAAIDLEKMLSNLSPYEFNNSNHLSKL